MTTRKQAHVLPFMDNDHENSCNGLEELFYKEHCIYTRPIETLYAIFGEINCIFTDYGTILSLKLEPSGLEFSKFVNSAPTIELLRTSLAQSALSSIPPRRVATMLCNTSLYNDASLSADPNSWSIPLPRRVIGTKRQFIELKDSSNERCIRQLAAALRCKVNQIKISFLDVRAANGDTYLKCICSTPTRVFDDPHLIAKTIRTAEQHALLNALILVSGSSGK